MSFCCPSKSSASMASSEDTTTLAAADKLSVFKPARLATRYDLRKAAEVESKSYETPVIMKKFSTQVEHNTALDIYEESKATRKTGIVCTLGPASQSLEVLFQLLDAGMNIARLNFSHGTYEYHTTTIANARKAAADRNVELCIALDTKGPEIRTGNFVDGAEVTLECGKTVRLTTDESKKDIGTVDEFYVTYTNIVKVVSVGATVFIDDGLVSLRVAAIGDDYLDCEVVDGGPVSNHKGVNLPNINVDLPALSEKDKCDLQFGVEQGLDLIFASFVRKPEDVRLIREHLIACDATVGKRIKIISKIENHEGVQKFDEILQLTDGVMVARGDLGIEIPPEKVFLAQKMMISKCNLAGKPIIVATQMLESMIKNARPTRAEVSDVANAVLDGTDCVMLSGETAKGCFPHAAVQMMARICREAESARNIYLFHDELRQALPSPLPTADIIAGAAVQSCSELRSNLLVVLTNRGDTARLVAKYRPACPIVAVVGATHAYSARQLALCSGVYAITYDDSAGKKDCDERVKIGVAYAKSRKWVKSGELLVAVHADEMGKGYANLVRILPVL